MRRPLGYQQPPPGRLILPRSYHRQTGLELSAQAALAAKQGTDRKVLSAYHDDHRWFTTDYRPDEHDRRPLWSWTAQPPLCRSRALFCDPEDPPMAVQQKCTPSFRPDVQSSNYRPTTQSELAQRIAIP